MNMTDPVADMLTRIRNGIIARHSRVVIPSSTLKVAIAGILKDEGYIRDFEVREAKPQSALIVSLKYVDKHPVLTNLKRVSKPGRRMYTRRDQIPMVRGGLGTAIISTPEGVMTGRQAYQRGLGGEVLCFVW
jgi:small subunit ribosomal protein S8